MKIRPCGSWFVPCG